MASESTMFGYVFPAIRGTQSRREFFVSMCPLRLIPKIFLFDEEELVPELRAQRTLNRARIPEMARYIGANRDSYVFSALTASIDATVSFEPLSPSGEGARVGLLRIPMDARFIINDGQHRRAAIELALRDTPDLADETIAIVFYLDPGLERCQQMFADLNRHAVRPSRSIGLLYDHRDDCAALTRLLVMKSPFFRDVVEMEKSTLSPRSRKLFTLSALYSATSCLLEGLEVTDPEVGAERAVEFWNEVVKQFPEWVAVQKREMTAGEIRKDYLHSHGIVLQAIGQVGNVLLTNGPKNWKSKLKPLQDLDWSRSNAKLWEGRAMIGGRVSKASHNVTLTTNAIKLELGIELTPEERRAEAAFGKGKA